jgi:hypothetical protein
MGIGLKQKVVRFSSPNERFLWVENEPRLNFSWERLKTKLEVFSEISRLLGFKESRLLNS